MLMSLTIRKMIAITIAAALAGCGGDDANYEIATGKRLAVENFGYSLVVPKGLHYCPAASGGNVHGYVIYGARAGQCKGGSTEDKYISLWADFNVLKLPGEKIFSRNCKGYGKNEFPNEGNFSEDQKRAIIDIKGELCGKFHGNVVEITTFLGLDSKSKKYYYLGNSEIPDRFIVVRLSTFRESIVEDAKKLNSILESVRYN